MNLVLVPGFMTDASLWDDVAEDLRRIGPLTFGDASRDDAIEAIADHILADAPPRFAAIGFSMGGYVAREMVRRAPERIEALVLLATSARGDTPDQIARKTRALARLSQGSFRGLSRAEIARSLHPDRAGDAALIERIHAMGEALGGEVFARQAAMVRDGDLDRLAAIRCPTLIVAAAQDSLRSLDEAAELQAGIAGSELRVVKGCGHMLPIEAPAALVEAVAPWLERLAG